MRFFSIVGNSFGCSASGERLVSAARDGDFQEAKALLEYNPRLVRYSTFGVRNSPLHYSAAQGHHEIVSLLLESGVDINLRNYRGQTALMEACQYGHWEVVQTLIIFKANIHRADYVNGGTALHCAALNGHTRCIRLLLGDYLPSIPNLWKTLQDKSGSEESSLEFNGSALRQVINKPADGGITALHMAALKGHYETVQFLLDLGASVTVVTVEDGGAFDLIGAGSTPLHYAAAGGNAQCCQILIARGADLSAQNVKGSTPLMVARSWNRQWLNEILLTNPQDLNPEIFPSPCLSLPLFSVISIARECGWRRADMVPTCQDDPCAVCLERKCSVAAQGCGHEFCTQCALYLCTMTSGTTTSSSSSPMASPPGSIPCPLCRHSIVSFTKLPEAFQPSSHREIARTSFSLSLCACSCDSKPEEQAESQLIAPLCEPTPPLLHSSSSPSSSRVCPLGPSFRSSSCQRFPSVLNSAFCMGSSETTDSAIGEGGSSHRNLRNHLLMGRCLRPGQLRRSTSTAEGRSRAYPWFCYLDPNLATTAGAS